MAEADTIQANYDQLGEVAARFAAQAEANENLSRQIKQCVQALQNGGWEGKGSQAFFAEMESEVSPAMGRLTRALQEARSVTLQIDQILHQAEEEAAAVFRGGEAGTIGGNGRTGVTSGAPGGSKDGPSAPGPGGTPIQPMPGSGGKKGGSFWDHVRIKGDFWSFDGSKEDGSRRGGKFDPGIKATIGIKESSLWGEAKDGVAVVGGYGEAGFKASLQEGVFVGAGGEFYTVKGEWDTAFVGDKEYGVTGSAGFKGPGAEGFFGVQYDGKDKRIGGTIGGTLVSAEGSLGGNIAGYNVGAKGEIGLKAELGLEIGRKGVEVKLPFVSVGLKFGEGVD